MAGRKNGGVKSTEIGGPDLVVSFESLVRQRVFVSICCILILSLARMVETKLPIVRVKRNLYG